MNQLQKAKIEGDKPQSEKRDGVAQTADKRSSAKSGSLRENWGEIAVEQCHFHEEFNKPSRQPSRGSDTTSLGFPIRCRKIFQAIRRHWMARLKTASRVYRRERAARIIETLVDWRARRFFPRGRIPLFFSFPLFSRFSLFLSLSLPFPPPPSLFLSFSLSLRFDFKHGKYATSGALRYVRVTSCRCLCVTHRPLVATSKVTVHLSARRGVSTERDSDLPVHDNADAGSSRPRDVATPWIDHAEDSPRSGKVPSRIIVDRRATLPPGWTVSHGSLAARTRCRVLAHQFRWPKVLHVGGRADVKGVVTCAIWIAKQTSITDN